MTLEHLIKKLVQFYGDLLGSVNNLPENSHLGKCLHQLHSIKNEELTCEQLESLLMSSLYALTLSIASGYLSSQAIGKELKLEDINNIGVSSEIKGRLKSRPNSAASFFFETMVRAWYGQYFGTTFPDLVRRSDFKDRNACEFKIERDNFIELVECKKVVSCSDKEKLMLNFRDRLEDAEKQFNDTKEVLNIKNNARHLLVDVSKCSDSKREVECQSRIIIVKGNTPEELNNIKKIIRKEIENSEIEQVSIISDSMYLIDGQARGIIQFPEIVRDNKFITNYCGWTVTAFSGRLFEEPIKELMIYSDSLPEKDIIGKQDSLDGQFFWQGPAQSTSKV